MIRTRIARRYRITIPAAVRRALGLRVGDRVFWRIEGAHAVMMREPGPQPDPFATFSEWDSVEDRSAYDRF